MNGLPPEAAIWRVDGQQWTIRDELLAIAVERIDHWGLAQAYIHSNGKGLPSESIQLPRPSELARANAPADQETPRGDQPKKDRYQKSRERAAFFS